MQVYMPTSDYEDDELEKLYDTIEEILEEDGKDDTRTYEREIRYDHEGSTNMKFGIITKDCTNTEDLRTRSTVRT